MNAITYRDLVGLAAASLAPDEYWCIDHDEGPIPETASKDIGHPVRVFCEALNIEWDQATESGFRLGKITIQPDPRLQVAKDE